MFSGPNVTPTTASPSTESFLGFFTMTNASTASDSAAMFQLGFPVVSQSGSIRIYTSDTAGNSASALTTFGVDATSSDMTGAVRLQIISGVTAISGSQTLKFWVYDSPTAPPTGTAISSASLLSTSWRISASVNIEGTTHIVDTSGFGTATTSFSASQVVFHGSFMSNPFRSCLVWSAPVQSGGGGMRLWFHVYASKTASGAVTTSNAILPVETDLVIRNMDAARNTPSAACYHYGLTVARATSMTDGTLITSDQTDFDGNVTRMVYARSSPSATITLSGTTPGFVNISRSAGSWDTDILGAHIRPVTSSGTAGAYVVSRTSGTTVSAYIYSTVSSTSFTSTNWAQEGVGHPYGATWTMRVVVGAMPTCATALGNHTSAVTPTTVAQLNAASQALVLNNYGFTASNVTFSMTSLNLMRADNAIRPFTQLGPEGTFMGDIETDIGAVSDREDIGFTAQFCLEGYALPTANGRRKMFENSLWFHTSFYNGTRRYSGTPSAGSLGIVPQQNNGTNYSYDNRWGTWIPQPLTWSPWDMDNGHSPETNYVAYLYTGRLIYLERMQEKVCYMLMCSLDPGGAGSGLNQTVVGDSASSAVGWGAQQQRSSAWILRDQLVATFCTPDATNSNIYAAKSVYETSIEALWTRATFVKNGATNTTGSDWWYSTDSARYVGYRFNGNVDFAPWQTRYWDWTILSARELGLTTSVSQSFLEWMSVGYVGASQSPDVAPDYLTTAYYTGRVSVNGSQTEIAPMRSWADQYQAAALWPYGYEATGSMRVPASMTLSSVSGAAITVTFTGGPLGATSWYAGNGSTILGGWISDGTGGKGQITAVANSNSCTVTTLSTGAASFTTVSPTAANCRIPMPAPADAGAPGSVHVGDTTYAMLYRLAGEMYADVGVSTSACISYIEGRVGFPATIKNKLNINSR